MEGGGEEKYPHVTESRLKLNDIRAMFGLIQRNSNGQWLAGIQRFGETVQNGSRIGWFAETVLSISRIAFRIDASFASWTDAVDLAREAALGGDDFLLGIVVRI